MRGDWAIVEKDIFTMTEKLLIDHTGVIRSVVEPDGSNIEAVYHAPS